MNEPKAPTPIVSSALVRCPVCGEKMEEPLTAKTCERKSGPTKWEKLWLCQKDGYLLNGKVSKYPFPEWFNKIMRAQATQERASGSSPSLCSARLTAKIERELGQIVAGPTEINRGYWAYNSDVFRWCVVINADGHQRYYGCATAMANCLKGKLTRWKSNRGHGEWEIIVEPNDRISDPAHKRINTTETTPPGSLKRMVS